jgi:hypothetical protein
MSRRSQCSTGSSRHRQVRMQEAGPSSVLWSAPGSRSESPTREPIYREPSRKPSQSHRPSLLTPMPPPGMRVGRRRSIREALEAIEAGQLVPPSRKQSLFAAYSPASTMSPLLGAKTAQAFTFAAAAHSAINGGGGGGGHQHLVGKRFIQVIGASTGWWQ